MKKKKEEEEEEEDEGRRSLGWCTEGRRKGSRSEAPNRSDLPTFLTSPSKRILEFSCSVYEPLEKRRQLVKKEFDLTITVNSSSCVSARQEEHKCNCTEVEDHRSKRTSGTIPRRV
uniref:Uncharacterized protein n=1 Tax=Vespula pensylvanica TaxID=30213 RepID=A0A834U9P9_VESPE|nr:hypothetical protein H0235_009066 [Vespula pensylvanica]